MTLEEKARAVEAAMDLEGFVRRTVLQVGYAHDPQVSCRVPSLEARIRRASAKAGVPVVDVSVHYGPDVTGVTVRLWGFWLLPDAGQDTTVWVDGVWT